MPIIGQTRNGDDIGQTAFPNFEALFAFSPDSRRLAFVSPEPFAEIGSAPSEDTQTDGAIQPQLNVIDLTSQTLLGSVPSSQEMLTWSPDNEHLVYQNPDRNWQLFDMHNHSSIPVTVGNGAQLSWPAWSFSGSYIKFWKSENSLADSYLTDTYILEIPSELP